MHVFTVKKGKFRIVKNAIQDLNRKNQNYKNHKKYIISVIHLW